ncbi:2'-5' RNA ligase family protein [Flavobacterium johnsoniae]|uniref:2',5' RNA ligase n=1 Tax=Flavobacterium johnsoniae (strain ATCC 17061 / DSM 2064 / JCM 8514 / BCRC 14874 / CCUG 350202 / NBRC 14942 / NCIMB 11054 / UW101) TaxID=376686 RepID=A5FBZ1_FLAJ1|nr:2'-5' RNA ligase family protein [Flavobacterium johnsoniae]ABQ07284.1 2',5' RNA ligase [Flavobacterium johnsoniae UW101]OXE95646.1 2'-5' RNA ligase [Flavobacterium johnsoniae UW101]WQG80881.1 2'-5' RNA ligase family protein [Flavobacterium johnsoniae UW101]SHL17649.1 2'-5' RNA ligase [Flavobacterium johnsoniae]
MEKTYSVVFYSKTLVEPVKKLKDFLRSKIKWYNSCNSEAHITICEFTIDESKLDSIKQKLAKISDTFTPFQVNLDHFDSFPKAGAFFIGVNDDSKNNLVPIMKKTHETLKPLKHKSDNPHLSIGRKLTPENLKIASELFTTIDLQFECNEIVLREFDPLVKQFFVIDSFKFGSNPEPEFVQGRLF